MKIEPPNRPARRIAKKGTRPISRFRASTFPSEREKEKKRTSFTLKLVLAGLGRSKGPLKVKCSFMGVISARMARLNNRLDLPRYTKRAPPKKGTRSISLFRRPEIYSHTHKLPPTSLSGGARENPLTSLCPPSVVRPKPENGELLLGNKMTPNAGHSAERERKVSNCFYASHSRIEDERVSVCHFRYQITGGRDDSGIGSEALRNEIKKCHGTVIREGLFLCSRCPKVSAFNAQIERDRGRISI